MFKHFEAEFMADEHDDATETDERLVTKGRGHKRARHALHKGPVLFQLTFLVVFIRVGPAGGSASRRGGCCTPVTITTAPPPTVRHAGTHTLKGHNNRHYTLHHPSRKPLVSSAWARQSWHTLWFTTSSTGLGCVSMESGVESGHGAPARACGRTSLVLSLPQELAQGVRPEPGLRIPVDYYTNTAGSRRTHRHHHQHLPRINTGDLTDSGSHSVSSRSGMPVSGATPESADGGGHGGMARQDTAPWQQGGRGAPAGGGTLRPANQRALPLCDLC